MVATLYLAPFLRIHLRLNHTFIKRCLVGSSTSEVRVNDGGEVAPYLVLFSTFFVLFAKRGIRMCSMFKGEAYRGFSIKEGGISAIKFRDCILFGRAVNCILPMLSFNGRNSADLCSGYRTCRHRRGSSRRMANRCVFFVGYRDTHLLGALGSRFSALRLFGGMEEVHEDLRVTFLA